MREISYSKVAALALTVGSCAAIAYDPCGVYLNMACTAVACAAPYLLLDAKDRPFYNNITIFGFMASHFSNYISGNDYNSSCFLNLINSALFWAVVKKNTEVQEVQRVTCNTHNRSMNDGQKKVFVDNNGVKIKIGEDKEGHPTISFSLPLSQPQVNNMRRRGHVGSYDNEINGVYK